MLLLNRNIINARLSSMLVSIIIGFFIMASAAATETAPYDVIREDGKFELRAYPKMVLVSAPMQTDGERNRAFRKLFSYISGDNAAEQKIAMTAPVFMDSRDSDDQKMAFVMPEDMPLEKTPAPGNASVEVTETTPQTYATVRFNGRLTPKSVAKYQPKLEEWIAKNGLIATGAAKTAGYNSPFTLPFMRRNEILIPVVEKEKAGQENPAEK